MRWLAASVHVLTAFGAVAALFATLAIFDHQAERMFLWLGIALIIDGIDGIFARAIGVSERLPRFSGEVLDLVVDYLNYVFVPVLALLAWHYLDGPSGLAIAALILLSSLYHFADTQSKTKDNAFAGFPAIWNIVAFYVFALALSPGVTAAVCIAAIVLTFVPVPWVHPFRVALLRPLSVMAAGAFAVSSIVTVTRGLPATPLHQAVMVVVAIYGVGLSAYLWTRQEPR